MKIITRTILSDDIVESCVLPRLPVKPLLRLKSVCRRWYDLISNDHSFALQQHYQNSCTSHTPTLNFEGLGLPFKNIIHECNRSLSVSITRDQTSVSFADLITPRRGFRIIASSNGLVVISTHLVDDKDDILAPQFFVGNPLHKDWKWIPGKTYIGASADIGLMFDPVNALYQLVCPCNYNKDIYEFEVFSSETGEWEVSKSQIMLPDRCYVKDNAHVSFGGILYWLVGDGSFRRHLLMWYDTNNVSSGLKPMPAVTSGEKLDGILNKLNGSIIYTRIRETEIEVWSMKGNFLWTKSHHIPIKDIDTRNPTLFATPAHQMNLKSTRRRQFDDDDDDDGGDEHDNEIVWGQWNSPPPIAFDGKVVFFMVNEKTPWSYDVETGETTRYQTLRYAPSRRFLYEANLIQTPAGRHLKEFPPEWQRLPTKKQGHICFECSHGILIVRTGMATSINYKD